MPLILNNARITLKRILNILWIMTKNIVTDKMASKDLTIKYLEPENENRNHWPSFFWSKPFLVRVTFATLWAIIAIFSIVMIEFLANGVGTIETMSSLTVILIMLFGTSLVVLKGKGWSFAVSLMMSLFLLLFNSTFLVVAISKPSYPGPFWSAYSSAVLFILVIILSVLAIIQPDKWLNKGSKKNIESSTERYIVPLFMGVIIGGLIVGLAAGATISEEIDDEEQGEVDVSIALGSSSPFEINPYEPSNVVVTIENSTVTWYNGDNTMHTVTSTTGLFDSKSIEPGESWSFTFTSTGKYNYYCSPHPYMTGSVEVV